MSTQTAVAQAHPNIAFIKYWGNRDQKMRLPSNPSISMNLDGLITKTTVTFDESLTNDALTVNNMIMAGAELARVSIMLDEVRGRANLKAFAKVTSENNFPMAAGIASSASAFAALALASSTAAGLKLKEEELSRLARHGSGSASRSIPSGFVELKTGDKEEDAFSKSIAPAEHWNLVDCVTVIATGMKPVGSSEGHALAESSPLQSARLADAGRRLEICRKAILEKDFPSFADIVELDSNMMHAVMLTSKPVLMYWRPATLMVMDAVREWRASGLECCYTVDAGANVHVICTAKDVEDVHNNLRDLGGITRIYKASVGGAAKIV